ncbi:hypothetical protein ASE63_22445 [Bosea sp. Root381]|uniref:hypothetical protein n=1 Tax=Bosea sp. Root381 TaxID=1736524 RepID=UPI0006F5F50A|nr:hypothetical protein [Bosea sp. Root381]KRE07462.1 hypothetical protein ASE63_22445 [Bosea sp. Root381]
MILDELISKLGFEVDGIQKLRAARKEWDKTLKASAKGNKTLIATSRSTAVAATGASRLGTALRTILGVFARLLTVAAGVAAGVAAVGTAFVIAGVRAARARRAFVLTAKEMGTTGQNMETLGNILRVAGFGDGFEAEAKKVVGAIDEIAKTVRKGGDDAAEAKKKFQGFGINDSFNVDPKTGKSRDTAAIALDVFQAYKRATEQAANLRKEADAIGNKAPRKAAALRKKAIEQDRKTDQLAEDAGIGGRLRVLLDSIALKDLPELVRKAASLFPTTSNKSEGDRDNVARQAEDAALKASALLEGTADRLTEIGVALATHVLPPLNAFLDKLVSFGKATGLIAETGPERDARQESEREARRAESFSTPRTQGEAEKAAELSQKRFEDSIEAAAERARQRRRQSREGETGSAPAAPDRQSRLTDGYRLSQNAEDRRRTSEPARSASSPTAAPSSEGWLQYFRRMLSPEANASKLQKTAEQKTVNQSDFGNDQRSITNNVTVNGAPQEGLASAVAGAVNQAVSRIKASNASTAGAGAP